jgi:ribonuclease G
MLKEILIQVTMEETKVAVLEKRRLVEVYLERSFQMRLAGNIYKGRIENVLPGMQAAFVNIGLERNAFLYVEDVHMAPGKRENLPIQNMLREGGEILVQVVKEPFGTKGARVTTQLTLPGRYVVLLPDLACIGVSRRITQERERERLKILAEEVRISGSGLIVRTVAEGVSRDELAEDVAVLYELWKRTKEKSARYSAPAMLYQDLELVSWVLRDLVGEEIDRLVVNEPETYDRILELLGSDAHSFGRKVQLLESDLWEDYGIDQEVTRALRPKVWLRSGGYLVIDETEALTVIDVNTGKYTGSKNFADTVFRTNLEAIPEIVRQVRLRNLGGIIIVDFIDMEVLEHRAEVLRRLDEDLKRDKTRTYVLGLTHLGLVEMTRKKVRPSLSSLLERLCPYCDGKGRVLSEETVGLKTCQDLREFARTNPAPAVMVEVNPGVAAFLIGGGGSHLRSLEQEIGKQIIVKGSEAAHLEDVQMRPLNSQEEIANLSAPVHPGQILKVKIEEAHSSHPANGIGRVQGFVIDVDEGGVQVGKQAYVEIAKVFRTYAKARIISLPETE